MVEADAGEVEAVSVSMDRACDFLLAVAAVLGMVGGAWFVRDWWRGVSGMNNTTKPAVDVRRTVKATHAAVDDAYLQPGEHCHTEPGKARKYGNNLFMFACPGCGVTGSIRAGHPKPDNSNGATWDVTGGSLDDPTTLTLSPSINCVGCCGWHGWLKGGVFESC